MCVFFFEITLILALCMAGTSVSANTTTGGVDTGVNINYNC